MAEAQAIARALNQIRSIAHALLAAGYHYLRLAAANGLYRLLHSFQPGTANQIDGNGRSFNR